MSQTVDHRNDPANRDPQCEGGAWCRCPVSTPCLPGAADAAEVTHPAWCSRQDNDREQIHYTALLPVEPDGPSMVRIDVQAMHAWPHPELPDLGPRFVMVIEDEGVERHHFLPPSQIRDLIDNLQLLLGQVAA